MTIGNHSISAFHLCGAIGLTLAMAIGFVLTSYLSLSINIIMLLMVVTVITFFILAMFSKILTGKEQLIYYHQKIAILTATAIALWFVAVPILPYLDIMTLGIGTFMVCGRFGCFMMGCCHCRPNPLCVCYQHEHLFE